MSEITALTPQIKDKNRLNVYIDGKFVCGIGLETAIKYKLKVGVSLTKERLLEIEFDSEKTKAIEKATAYISRAMKTEKQLTDYLAKKGYGTAVISFTLDKLKSYGYIDDVKYAVAYIKTYSKKKGEKLIKYELKQKGISDEDFSLAIKEQAPFEDACFSVAEKYMARKEKTRENLAKLYKYLLSKGFSYDQVGSVVDKFKGE